MNTPGQRGFVVRKFLAQVDCKTEGGKVADKTDATFANAIRTCIIPIRS